MNAALVALISVVLGGGLFTGVGALLRALATARNLRAAQEVAGVKLPSEVDSVIVSGAEKAVLTMQHALEAAERRIAELERREEEAERIIGELRHELTDLRGQIDTCHRQLEQAQSRVTALSERLSAIDHTDTERG